MSVQFPPGPAFSGFNAPFRTEVDVHDLEVEGELPKGLNGHFYRVQPDFLYPPRYANDVPFNGDGHVSLFRFDNGHADLRCRYVRTQRYKAQADAREALFGTYRNPRTDDPRVQGVSAGTANTNLVFHAGKLFALKEDSPPVQIDPHTLETIDDYHTFGGKMRSLTFTAHPKLDPVNGEMIAIGYEAKGEATRDVALYAIDRNGEVSWEAWIEVPYAGMIHDIAITQTHVALLVIPMAVNVPQMEQGGVHFAWDSSLPSWFGVVKRGGDGSDVRWYKGPERSATHVMNGFNDGSKIIVDMDMSEGNQFPFFPSLHEPFDGRRASGRLTRLSVDLDSDQTEYDMQVMHDPIGVLPRVDERYWSLPYNVGFMPCTDFAREQLDSMRGTTGLVLNTWVRMDHNPARTTAYFAGPQYGLQEPQFVPRSADAPEGDGWIIGLANNHETMRSELHIVDALDMKAGAVAKLKLAFRLKNGVHGHWVDAAQLPPRS